LDLTPLTFFSRVQAHAASAIINISEQIDMDLFAPYVDAILAKFVGLLQQGNTMVQETVITAIAAVAEATSAQFLKVTNTFHTAGPFPLRFSLLLFP
jgi:hypothetical protein